MVSFGSFWLLSVSTLFFISPITSPFLFSIGLVFLVTTSIAPSVSFIVTFSSLIKELRFGFLFVTGM